MVITIIFIVIGTVVYLYTYDLLGLQGLAALTLLFMPFILDVLFALLLLILALYLVNALKESTGKK